MKNDLQTTIETYLQAWTARDVDAIVALHTPDTVFRLHVLGETDAVGHDQVRAAFTKVFETWPDLAFNTLRLNVGADFFAHQMNVWGTPRNLTGHPDNATREAPLPVHYEMLDVIIVRDGKIHRKDTFVDTLAILAGTSIVENAA